MNKTDNKFIQDNLGLVHSLAARFKGRGIEYEELFAAGCEGLVKAGLGFDEGRGLKFSTYAVPVILGEIRRLFRDGGTVKVSRGLKELSLKAARVQEELRKNGNEPRLSDIAKALGVSVEQAGEAVAAALPPVSLTVSDEEGEQELDVPVPPEQAKLTERIALNQCLALLDEEERRLIVIRYIKNKTQTETGEIMGLSQVQVSRKEKKALKRLRELLEN
ncbi:MAG: sigma-70 family RNA polymerase sigma factor [Ruminococcaceae bacterium]|nr:sigma-70 family RNA polymerase sigma factor [Oscillospiraceae bacterium]